MAGGKESGPPRNGERITPPPVSNGGPADDLPSGAAADAAADAPAGSGESEAPRIPAPEQPPQPASPATAGPELPPGSAAYFATIPPPPPPMPPRPRARPVFSLEGRAAPGLYAAAWGLTIFGIAVFVFLLAAGPASGGLGVELLLEASFALVGAGLVSGAGSQALQRRADRRPGYFGPSPFLTFGALFFALAAVEYPVGRVLQDVLGIHLSDAGSTLVSLLVNVAGYVALVQLLVVGVGALSWREIVHPRHLSWDPPEPPALPGSLEPPGPPAPELVHGAVHPAAGARRDLTGDVLWAVSLLVPLLVTTNVVVAVLLALLRINPSTVPQTLPLSESDLPNRLVNLVSVAIVAPIGEEIFFRGYATSAWARTARFARALALSAVFFALVHVLVEVTAPAGASASEAVSFAVLAFGARLPVSLALAWLYLRRRSIYASATLHGLYNAVLLILSWSVP